MNSGYSRRLVSLSYKLLILAGVYQLSRIIFLIANSSSFNNVSTVEIITAFLWGFRFDFSALFTINIPVILLYLIPGNWFYKAASQKLINIVFYVLNIPFILLNCIDLEYFKYQGKRTTSDFFQLFTMGDDMKNTIPKMAADFWYVIVIFIVLSVVLILATRQIKPRLPDNKSNPVFVIITFILTVALTIILARGGFQYKPLNVMSGARLTSPQLVPLVLNTPFTIIRTYGKSLTEEKRYMPDDEALKYFSKIHQYNTGSPFLNKNVVIIILESFSAEYIGALNNGEGFTPFLDSLMGESVTFTNAFANAKKSIDGIPAVVASIPTLMPASYISTPYSSNRLHSIAAILKTKGYSSAFFHGGNNGTMNFDNFTRMTGFDKYYGRSEYPGDNYDGHWGVFDENFYYFFIDKCNEAKKPFVNAFFSLSSHHPYSMPDTLRDKFPDGTHPIHKSIGYADYALRKFFERASKTDWYNNTMFVITADHTGPATKIKYNTRLGMFRIPVVFYIPGTDLKGFRERTTQQTDIVPGILQLLNYDEPFVAFGNSMFDSTKSGVAINYPGDLYQAVGNNLLIQFDGSEITGTYSYKTDTLLLQNLPDEYQDERIRLQKTLESYIQQFNSALIGNKLIP